MKKSEIKLFIGNLLILSAIVLYILLHGTSNLFVVKKMSGMFGIIPVFYGIKINSIFLNGYAVDIIWIISFNLIVSIFNNRFYTFFVLCFSIFLEALQLLNNNFGTFDFIDILIYTFTTILFILFMNKKEI